jgi:hypothetical protein
LHESSERNARSGGEGKGEAIWAQTGTRSHCDEPDPANGFCLLRIAIEDFGPTWSVWCSAAISPASRSALCAANGSSCWPIRAYAPFAGLVVAATAVMPLLPGPLPWLILRGLVGFGCAGLFIVSLPTAALPLTSV